jgi:hypothetical protein
MSRLRLYLLGPPRLELDGESVHLPRRKATALLAYLVQTGCTHRCDSLSTLLWPENDQRSARDGSSYTNAKERSPQCSEKSPVSFSRCWEGR